MPKINFAILGAGGIAHVMAKTVVKMDNVILSAVAARDASRADAFAREYGFAKSYGSYEEMLADPDVQLVYVATPHSHHYKHILMCLEHGKHVLCEKAFTINAAQAEKACAAAREKGLLLTEAIWTRYMPFSKTVARLVRDGEVGDAVGLTANLGYNVRMNERIHDLALAGGALLDLSVYTLNFASMVFGTDFEKVVGTCVKYPTGVDAHDNIAVTFASGKMASLYATFMTTTDRQGIIYGDKGYLVVDNINNPSTAQVYDPEWRPVRLHKAPEKISGYEYEVQACIDAIESGAVECPDMPHAETIRIMRVMDAIRADWGIEYPEIS